MQQQVIKQQYLTLGLDRDVINTTLNRWNNHVSPSVWVQHYFLLFVSFVLKNHSTEMMNSRWRGVTFMMTACYVFIATTFQPLKTPHTLASVQSSDSGLDAKLECWCSHELYILSSRELSGAFLKEYVQVCSECMQTLWRSCSGIIYCSCLTSFEHHLMFC